MRTCTSIGCDNPTRGRRFNTKDNGRIYYEKKCRACENTLRRYGLTSPERKKQREVLAPSLPPSENSERTKDV